MAAPSCSAPVKVFVFFSTIVITLIGTVVMFLGARARFSANFHLLSTFMSVQSNDFLSSELVVVLVIALALLTVLCGCWGLFATLAERQCTLCGLSSLGLILGVLLIMGGLTVHMVVRCQGPIILKFMNRLCGPGAPGEFKVGLGCDKANVAEEAAQPSSLAQPITSSTTSTTTAFHQTTHQMTHQTTHHISVVKHSKESSHTATPVNVSSKAQIDKNTTADRPDADAAAAAAAKEKSKTGQKDDEPEAAQKHKPGTSEKDKQDTDEKDKSDAAETDEVDTTGKDKSNAAEKEKLQDAEKDEPIGNGWRRLQSTHFLSWMTAPSMTELGLGDTSLPSGLLSRLAVAFVLATEARQLSLAFQGFSSVAESSNQSRRLFPGITEESFLVRSCSRLGPKLCPSTCHLLDQICEEPPGFNPWTACVCDRSGPRIASTGPSGLATAECPMDKDHPMCQMDQAGRHMGAFCMSPTPDLSGSAGAAAESCFVLPSTKCASGTSPPDCIAAGSACISTGPCSNPDSRSQIYVEGQEVARRFAICAGLLGLLTILSSLCICCLCAELHTGRSTLDQVKSLQQTDPMPFEDEDDLLPLQGE